jgi:MFS family permease
MAAGVSFIRRNHVFGFLISMTYFNNFFALSAFTLFPAFAKDILHVGPSGLGLLYTAIGVGNLVGVILTANLGHIERRGWLILGGTVIEAGFLILFAVSTWFAASLVLLGLAGIGSSIFNVSAQSTLQVLVPDDFRGRVMGIWGLTHSTFQPLGQMQMGTMAALVSPPFAVILGAGMVIAFAIAATRNHRVRELGVASASEPSLETA